MKRNLSLWLGLLAFAILPALSQTPKPMGKIHGHVTNPVGTPQVSGAISLSTDGGHTPKYTFPVSENGDYAGEAPAGTYTLVFTALDTAPGKAVDSFDNVKIVAGQDTLQDDDMSRKEYIDKNLDAEQKRKLEDLKKQNSKQTDIIKNLNADITAANQDIVDASAARKTAKAALGDAASKDDVDAKEAEIKTAKYTEVETMMLRDTAAKPDAGTLWNELAQAELGLARTKNDSSKYDDAETYFKKALSVEAVASKPSPVSLGNANSGLGEIYARTAKVPEANAAYDAAAKANPPSAASYFSNEAALFVNAGNGDAAAAAADEAITADPKQALPYYLKGQGLIQKATLDPAGKMILPPGCAEAYQKYLDLAPTGQFVADVKGILMEASQVHNTEFGDVSSKKKKGK
jgi:tetratricopeptide (TPR) repeat protein